MKGFKKTLSLIVSVFMMLSIFNVPLNYAKANSIPNEQMIKDIIKSKLTKLEDVNYNRALSQKYGVDISNDNVDPQKDKSINANDKVRVIVQLDSPSIFEMTKGKKLSLQQSKELEANIEKEQKSIITKVDNMGDIRHKYKNLLNGFSAVVKYGDIDTISEIPGVKSVKVANQYYLDMNTASKLTKAPEVWQDYGLKGEGVVVAIVDTGIDYTHKDMRLTDSSKAKLKEKDVQALGGPGKYYTEKVPYGYNFADMNDLVIPQTSMHGMHVAGIVAANGLDEEIEENKAIKGVAPEAQLLAMKVFSNNPMFESAFNDDIAAAIEDSYRHGADVINMSLGSTAGFISYDDPEQIAIKNATDAGVVVVVSAGNSSYSTSSVYYPYKLDPDVSVVGSPGLFPDTLQIASSENTNILYPTMDYTAGEETGGCAYTVADEDPVEVLKGEYGIVDCGLGIIDAERNDFAGKDLSGKIALIQRGGITFVEKQMNAQNAGAAGVIVYNRDGDDSYINMATDPSVNIPAIFINNTDGKKLKSLIENVKVSFNGKLTTIENGAAGQMSDFSSWGTAPGLEFKPEVTAPGGNIYSTVNDNKYETMSGTSMAAPHASGAVALVVQHLKGLGLNLEKREFVNLAKTLMINSSEPIIDPATSIAYSPRQQGAGLIQIDRAVKTNAYAVDNNGNAAIALKEIGNNTEFNLVIKNFGNEDLTFALSTPYDVMTSYVKNGYAYTKDVKLANAAVSFSEDKVVVAAGESKEVTATLTIPQEAAKNIFAEGFIKLTEETGKNTDITVPFIGFYGKWSGQEGPRMFDAPIWDNDTYFGMTALLDNDTYFLGQTGTDEYGNPIINPECIGFSPNGDGASDGVMPLLSLMRNAKEFKVQIVDKDGNIVRDITQEVNMRKNYTDGRTAYYTFNGDWMWDGTIYDATTGLYKQAPEGNYTVRVMAKPDFENAEWYTLDMPVKLDVTAPTFAVQGEKLEGNNYKIKLLNESDGEGTGIQIYQAFVVDPNGSLLYNQALDLGGANTETTITIPGTNCTVVVAGMDYAGNLSIQPLKVQNNAVEIDITNAKAYYNEDDITINYTINDLLWNSVDHVGITVDDNSEINNEKNLSYTLTKPAEGAHAVKITLYSADGKNIGENSISFVVDRTNPEVNILKNGEQPDVDIRPLEDGRMGLVWKFNVSDKLSGYKLLVNGELFDTVEANAVEASKSYEYTTELQDGENTINVVAEDFAGNSVSAKASVTYDLNVPIIKVDSYPTWVMGKEANISGSIIWNSDDKIEKLIVDGNETVLNEDNTFSTVINTENYGEKDVTISANTAAGKTASYTIHIKFTPFSEALNNRFITNSPSFVIEYGVNTADQAIKSVKISCGQADPIVKRVDESSVVLENLVDGENQIRFEAIGEKGNVLASEDVIVYVDTVIPEVRLIDENGNDFSGNDYNRSDITLLAIPSEKLKTLTIDGESYPVDSPNGIPVQLHFEDGMNRFTVAAEDMAGNRNEYQFKIWVDTTPPSVVFDNLTSDKVVTSEETYKINMTVEDNVYGFKVYANGNQIAVEENGEGEGTGAKEVSYDYKVPEGKSILKLEAVDYLGNRFEKSFTFYRNYNSAVVMENAKEINKMNVADTEINVVFNGDTVEKITAENELENGKDYLVTENGITFTRNFLMTLPVGENNITINFKSGTTENILFTVTDGRSNDATLKYIKVNGNVIEGFSPDKLDYVCEISPSENNIPVLEYKVNDANSQVEYTPAEKPGDTAQIKVTAQNGTEKIYTVKFIVPIAIEKVSTETSYLPGNDAKVEFKGTNMCDQDRYATLIVCLYDENGNMVNYVTCGHTLKANETSDLAAVIKVPDNASGYTIRCFVWDTLDAMNPISDVYEFPIIQPK